MEIKGEQVEIKDLLKNENFRGNLHKIRENGLFLSDFEVELLDRYHIPYQSCKSIKDLLQVIDDVLDLEESDELEELAFALQEQHYYQETNK